MTTPRLWISIIGTNYDPGVWDALEASAKYASENGAQVVLHPIGNKCVQPYHGLAMMRNWAIVSALQEQASHVLITDSDMLFDLRAAHDMLQDSQMAVIPQFDQTALDKEYAVLAHDKDGFLEWSIMSCMLLDLKPFQEGKLSPILFHDFMAIDEDRFYWSYLSLYGIRPFQSTKARVKMLRRPTPMWALDSYARIDPEKQGDGTYLRFTRTKPSQSLKPSPSLGNAVKVL